MPDIEDVLTVNPKDPETDVENMMLWVPSELSPSERSSICTNNIAIIEEKLREAQCRDALAKLRNYLHTRSHFIKNRNTNIRGQRANTRAHSLINTISSKINRTAEKYRTAYAALFRLRGAGSWQKVLRELRSKDICGPTGNIDGAGDTHVRRKRGQEQVSCLGEGYRTTSWIWACGTVDAGEEGVTEGMLCSH